MSNTISAERRDHDRSGPLNVRRDMSTPSRDRYRTVVVGTGPAGVSAAIAAAAGGSVLLVEASSLPRDKSCGGMINADAAAFLTRFGQLPDSVMLAPATVRFRYVDLDHGIEKSTDLSFLNVDRAAFDAWLLAKVPDSVEVVERCVLAGCEQHPDGLDVTLDCRGQTVHVVCGDLIGADGARSAVRRLIGKGTLATYVTLQDRIRLDGDLDPWFDCIYTREIGEGFAYAYVVPKGDEVIVGGVYYPGTRRAGRVQDRVLDMVSTRIPGMGTPHRREACVALSVRSTKDVVHGVDRVLLAGEAGGFLSPSSGEGISFALRSGWQAGTAVVTATDGDALALYRTATRGLRASIRRRLRWLPVMESRLGKRLAGYVPSRIISRVTEDL